eukprot:TRINITY_DN3616_c0_g1_i2.p1 TRINITY_DN3616_c0_g1~~TRINITY_DN3616_c0_g1_i2.p1  ORF type:complete len:778 (+),score=249.19 TRINITY_DN3616_c0_g1_i2:62-2335(+)
MAEAKEEAGDGNVWATLLANAKDEADEKDNEEEEAEVESLDDEETEKARAVFERLAKAVQPPNRTGPFRRDGQARAQRDRERREAYERAREQEVLEERRAKEARAYTQRILEEQLARQYDALYDSIIPDVDAFMPPEEAPRSRRQSKVAKRRRSSAAHSDAGGESLLGSHANSPSHSEGSDWSRGSADKPAAGSHAGESDTLSSVRRESAVGLSRLDFRHPGTLGDCEEFEARCRRGEYQSAFVGAIDMYLLCLANALLGPKEVLERDAVREAEAGDRRALYVAAIAHEASARRLLQTARGEDAARAAHLAEEANEWGALLLSHHDASRHAWPAAVGRHTPDGAPSSKLPHNKSSVHQRSPYRRRKHEGDGERRESRKGCRLTQPPSRPHGEAGARRPSRYVGDGRRRPRPPYESPLKQLMEVADMFSDAAGRAVRDGPKMIGEGVQGASVQVQEADRGAAMIRKQQAAFVSLPMNPAHSLDPEHASKRVALLWKDRQAAPPPTAAETYASSGRKTRLERLQRHFVRSQPLCVEYPTFQFPWNPDNPASMKSFDVSEAALVAYATGVGGTLRHGDVVRFGVHGANPALHSQYASILGVADKRLYVVLKDVPRDAPRVAVVVNGPGCTAPPQELAEVYNMWKVNNVEKPYLKNHADSVTTPLFSTVTVRHTHAALQKLKGEMAKDATDPIEELTQWIGEAMDRTGTGRRPQRELAAQAAWLEGGAAGAGDAAFADDESDWTYITDSNASDTDDDEDSR